MLDLHGAAQLIIAVDERVDHEFADRVLRVVLDLELHPA